jgi:hypothetical protein
VNAFNAEQSVMRGDYDEEVDESEMDMYQLSEVEDQQSAFKNGGFLGRGSLLDESPFVQNRDSNLSRPDSHQLLDSQVQNYQTRILDLTASMQSNEERKHGVKQAA